MIKQTKITLKEQYKALPTKETKFIIIIQSETLQTKIRANHIYHEK